ncbi:MAG: response regulator transcription factor [Chloroflexota bacterium]
MLGPLEVGPHPVAQPKRILVVDNAQEMLQMVSQILDKAGFEVWRSTSGQEALNVIERNGRPHLAIVDIIMPGMDGFEFCQRVRAGGELPIIMLTALNQVDLVTRALEQFADDVITKPFSPGVLVARVQRVLRRVDNFDYARDPVVRVDEYLRVDFAGRQALVGNALVSLTPTEVRLLHILLQSGGRVVTLPALLGHLWPSEAATEERLRYHVSCLRRKIEPAPARPRYILTVPGRGYSFYNGRVA